MKQILTKEMVKQAFDDLKANGKKTTNAMLYAALGNRGSMSTLNPPQSPVGGCRTGTHRFSRGFEDI